MLCRKKNTDNEPEMVQDLVGDANIFPSHDDVISCTNSRMVKTNLNDIDKEPNRDAFRDFFRNLVALPYLEKFGYSDLSSEMKTARGLAIHKMKKIVFSIWWNLWV